MNVLVIYYSRTGLTRKVAHKIFDELKQKGLNVHIDEVFDSKNRSGPIGYIRAGKDAMDMKLTRISHNAIPKNYDLIIVGGPVWAWTVSPAIRSYVKNNSDVLKDKIVAFFATQGSSGADKKFEVMQQIIGVVPAATLIVNGKDFRADSYVDKVKEFVSSLKV